MSWIQEYLDFLKIGVVFLFIWILLRWIRRFESRCDPTLRNAMQILRALIVVLGGVGILQFLGIPLSGVIAFGGIGGLAVGLAAKDLLANFFGSLMIFLDKPFQVGDWVRSPDKEIEGTIEHIGWRLTRIRTLDQRPLFVPNSLFSTISLENPSRMTNRRIQTTLHFRHEDFPKIQNVLTIIEDFVKHHSGMDRGQPCFANLTHFGPYSLEATVCAFTKATQQLEFQMIQQEIFLKILEVVDAHGCKFALPYPAPQGEDQRKILRKLTGSPDKT